MATAPCARPDDPSLVLLRAAEVVQVSRPMTGGAGDETSGLALQFEGNAGPSRGARRSSGELTVLRGIGMPWLARLECPESRGSPLLRCDTRAAVSGSEVF
jgi:hypothetical protein